MERKCDNEQICTFVACLAVRSGDGVLFGGLYFVNAVADTLAAELPDVDRTLCGSTDNMTMYSETDLTFIGHQEYNANASADDISKFRSPLPMLATEFGLGDGKYPTEDELVDAQLTFRNNFKSKGWSGWFMWCWSNLPSGSAYDLLAKDGGLTDFRNVAYEIHDYIEEYRAEHRGEILSINTPTMFFNGGDGTVEWIKPTQIHTYKLERSIDGGAWTTLTTSGATVDSVGRKYVYEDTTLPSSGKVQYRVIVTSGSNTATSASNTADILPPPENLVTNGDFENQLNAWTKFGSNGNYRYTGNTAHAGSYSLELQYVSGEWQGVYQPTITATANTGNKYCEDANSLIPTPHMTGASAENHWSDNPAWRNGFLSFEELGEDHASVLKYTASSRPLGLTYLDWIDVEPNTSYTLTMDVKRVSSGNGRIALLDDNINDPAEFYTVSFSSTDSEWKTYSITFNTGVYSRVGFAIVDLGGSAYIDKTRLFKTADGIATEPEDALRPVLKPIGGETSVMEMGEVVVTDAIQNGGFESGSLSGYAPYQSTVISSQAAYKGAYGAHLKGDGSWGALLEQYNIPVENGASYTFSYWYKANASGANITLKGNTTAAQYAYAWASVGEWTQVTATFTVSGDTTLLLNICGGGTGVAEDLYLDDVSLLKQGVGPDLGVAFLIELETVGATINERYVGDLTNATVDVYDDDESYKLVEMGALLTNKTSIANDLSLFNREYLDGGDRLVDVPAVKLYKVTDTTASYAVRLINIPYAYANTLIYARPYYVFEKDGQEIVVYGDVYSRSYNDSGADVPLD